MTVRLWFKPNGTVTKTSFAPWLSPEERAKEEARVAAQHPAGTTFRDVDEADLPPQSTRYKWRHRDGDLIVDDTVPAPPHPKQKVLDAIDKAKTVDDLKALIRGLV